MRAALRTARLGVRAWAGAALGVGALVAWPGQGPSSLVRANGQDSADYVRPFVRDGAYLNSIRSPKEARAVARPNMKLVHGRASPDLAAEIGNGRTARSSPVTPSPSPVCTTPLPHPSPMAFTSKFVSSLAALRACVLCCAAAYLGAPLAKVETISFADGETSVKFSDDVEGQDVVRAPPCDMPLPPRAMVHPVGCSSGCKASVPRLCRPLLRSLRTQYTPSPVHHPVHVAASEREPDGAPAHD